MLHLQTAFLLVLAAGSALHCRAQNNTYTGVLPQGGILHQVRLKPSQEALRLPGATRCDSRREVCMVQGDRLYSQNRSSTQLGEVFLTQQSDGKAVRPNEAQHLIPFQSLQLLLCKVFWYFPHDP